jgi:hypothetical protein
MQVITNLLVQNNNSAEEKPPEGFQKKVESLNKMHPQPSTTQLIL